jgi:4-hydroxy-tetrahydrodipicolinate reductase
MKLLLVGYGRMGRMIEELAAGQGDDIAGRVDHDRPEWADADVAIDFSTAEALLRNFPEYVRRRLPVVIGTTGWGEQAPRLRDEAQRHHDQCKQLF